MPMETAASSEAEDRERFVLQLEARAPPADEFIRADLCTLAEVSVEKAVKTAEMRLGQKASKRNGSPLPVCGCQELEHHGTSGKAGFGPLTGRCHIDVDRWPGT